ncbi:hypothetical protein LGM90_29210 [Burkholderia sp. AU28942]|uniref:hypothetical protein n=1 Tax=Burkholderia TaxID=32008 RepID=UPI0012EAE622|nr:MULTISPECIES: hypothetical protein [Burkholderia]MCA8312593.1 hypothetical protein [Burkholderia sp. AU28942]QTO52636.1 hypothetical protein J8I86_29470 [Burkholderia latens]
MLLWTTGNIEMRIWPHDHCPPHVTAVCRPEGWTARFVFSMLTDDVSLWDIKPKRNAPAFGVVQQLAQEVLTQRVQCRLGWWKYQQHQYGVCLDNAPVCGAPGGTIVLWEPHAGQATPDGVIVAGTGVYVAGMGVSAQIDWGHRVTAELLKEV